MVAAVLANIAYHDGVNGMIPRVVCRGVPLVRLLRFRLDMLPAGQLKMSGF
jgi:hypothetical protein